MTVMGWKPGHVHLTRHTDVSSVDSSLDLSSCDDNSQSSDSVKGDAHMNQPQDRRVVAQSFAISPSTYLTMTLKNHKLTERIDPFSLEQAMYFEPYEESDIPLNLLQALRSNDLERLLMVIATEKYDLEVRNLFGENLAHLACRLGLSTKLLEYLVAVEKVPLNVRDKFGRSPLHNACMSPSPNFEHVAFLLEEAPKLFLFEDDSGKTPLECIPTRIFDRWTRFMAESAFLKRITYKLQNL